MTYYAVISKIRGKLSKIYDIFTDRSDAKKMFEAFQYQWIGLDSAYQKYEGYSYTRDDYTENTIKREPGLPAIISIDATQRKRVIFKIYAGKYKIEKQSEYLMSV